VARYRKTPKDRVGRSTISQDIESKVINTMPDYADIVAQAEPTIYDYLEALSNAQKKGIAQILRKNGFSIQTITDVDTVLGDPTNFVFQGTDLKNPNAFINAINRQLIGKEGGADTGVSVSVTKYGKEQIDNWVNNWLTENAGMGLAAISEDQAKYIRKAVKDYAAKESVTEVAKDKKGRTVTTYKPGVSEAGIQDTIKRAVTELFPKEVERNKVFEFNNILNKTLGTGSI
jgi:hypothetical protein